LSSWSSGWLLASSGCRRSEVSGLRFLRLPVLG